MRAIILAAGPGSRIETLFPNLPKCLIQVDGVTLLEHQVAALRSCGVQEIVVVKGFQHEKIQLPGLKYYLNARWDATNILASLVEASKEIAGPVIILYSDILFEADVVKRLLESKADISIGVLIDRKVAFESRDPRALQDLELVSFDGNNEAESIGKKSYGKHSNIGQFIGMMYLTEKGARVLSRHLARVAHDPAFPRLSLCDLLDRMVQLGVKVNTSIVEKGWLEINSQEDYARASRDTEFIRRLSKVQTDWGRRASRYDMLAWVSNDQLLTAILDVAGDVAGKRLLDVGTGTGKVLEAFWRAQPEARYYGIDTSWEMLMKMDGTLPARRVVADVENLSCFPEHAFDVVTARMVLHHVGNLGGATREIFRVLKHGGKFIVCEGNPPDTYSGAFYTEMFRLKEDRHTFFESDLINLLVRGGFSDVTTKTIIMRKMSLMNWLANSDLPQWRIDRIREMHETCDERVKDAYNMVIQDGDIMMDWKFSVVFGCKPGR